MLQVLLLRFFPIPLKLILEKPERNPRKVLPQLMALSLLMVLNQLMVLPKLVPSLLTERRMPKVPQKMVLNQKKEPLKMLKVHQEIVKICM